MNPYPRVSCIMPTNNRRYFIPLAISYFLRQDYPDCELIILDDGLESVEDLVPADNRIVYRRIEGKHTIGKKRNLACELARGEIIVHWDDDDWHAPERISRQVTALQSSGAEICGNSRLYFLELHRNNAWQYTYPASRKKWVAGGTLCYWRSAWQKNPFLNLQNGEDTRFVWHKNAGSICVMDDMTLYIALIHSQNTARKNTRNRYWQQVPFERVGEIMEDDIDFYLAGKTSMKRLPYLAEGARRDKSTISASIAKTATSQPRVSIILPVHRTGAPLLKNTLAALNAQTIAKDCFEAVVVADGGDPGGSLQNAIREASPNYRWSLVTSERPHGDLPHRNHARNQGCQAASGEILWPLDADFLLPSTAIAHLLHEYDKCRETGQWAVFSPCLAQIHTNADDWLNHTDVRNGSLFYHNTKLDWGKLHLKSEAYSGFTSHYLPGNPLSQKWTRLREGFPAFPKVVWEALNGFDEEFVGWGGNKEEFVRRLCCLSKAGILEIRLLRSVLALHQPHRPDAGKSLKNARLAENRNRFKTILHQIEAGAAWWLKQKSAASACLNPAGRPQVEIPKPAQISRVPKAYTRETVVGILSVAEPSKGLWRDTETLLWAIESMEKQCRFGRREQGVVPSVFIFNNYHKELLENPRVAKCQKAQEYMPGLVKEGTPFNKWIQSLDILIGSEIWLENAFMLARKYGVRVIYIPNLDWAISKGDTEQWIEEVKKSDVEVWAKTRYAYQTLNEHGIDCHYIPWSIPDPVKRMPAAKSDTKVRFLFNAGMGGWQNRRSLDTALKAFTLAKERNPDIELVVKTIKPIRDYSFEFEIPENVLFYEGYSSRAELDKLYQSTDVYLYPTKWDGFGISLLEALHQGLPVLATHGDPFNEFVEDGHNGLFIEAKQVGMQRLTPHYECSPEDMAHKISLLAEDAGLRQRLTCPEPSVLNARQHRFLLRLQEQIHRLPRPHIVIFAPDAVVPERRSEAYWADAFTAFGFEVIKCKYTATDSEINEALKKNVIFIIWAKPPLALVRKIKDMCNIPCILWHHDLSNFKKSRWEWFVQAANLCDLVATPESGYPQLKEIRKPMRQIFPGARSDSTRGSGRRPDYAPDEIDDQSIVFLGQVSPDRHRILNELASAFRVEVYGNNQHLHTTEYQVRKAVWGKEAIQTIRSAGMVLSYSARNDICYTSNRLFNSAGAGGCILVKQFPGLEKIYPEDCLTPFGDEADLITTAAAVLSDKSRQQTLRIRAEEHTWRNHTWLDRIDEILTFIRQTSFSKSSVIDSGQHEPQRYWNERAKQYGETACGYFKWNRTELLEETEKAWQSLYPLIKQHSGGARLKVLDFGCGSGRFAKRFAQSNFEVTGVDISQEMLEIAKTNLRNNPCQLVHVSHELPFENKTFDIVWCFIVLQHIPDNHFFATVRELKRVIKPGGMIIIVENTHPYKFRSSTSGHVIFRRKKEYLSAFPGIRLIKEFDIANERHSVFWGRLRGDRRS